VQRRQQENGQEQMCRASSPHCGDTYHGERRSGPSMPYAKKHLAARERHERISSDAESPCGARSTGVGLPRRGSWGMAPTSILHVTEVLAAGHRRAGSGSPRPSLRVADVDPPTRRRRCSGSRWPILRVLDVQPPGCAGAPGTSLSHNFACSGAVDCSFARGIRKLLQTCKFVFYAPASLSREDRWKTR
jgi:hypothetical protein